MLQAKETIYLDNQSTTPVDQAVLEVMLPYFEKEFGNPHSVDHAMGWSAKKAIDQAVSLIAKMIGGDSDEIIFTSGATEANNLALLGAARKNKSISRQKIFVGATEHKCVLAAARAIQNESDFEIYTVPVSGEGFIDTEWLNEKVDKQTLMVSIMAVNNEIGTIAPIDVISEICHSKGVIFHCDAAQAPYAIDMAKLADQADLISLSAHKMYGPKGIGALYVSRELQSQIEPLIYGGGQQNNLRSGTLPTSLVVGFGKAASLVDEEWSGSKRDAMARIRNELWNLIVEIFPKVILNGPSLNLRHPGNLNIQFCGWSAKDLLLRLQPQVAASTGAACTSGIEEPSHVLKAIGLNDTDANSSVRFSIGKFSSRNHIEIAAKAIESCVSNT